MKVAKVEARCLAVPIKFPVTEKPYTAGLTLVQVETDDGVVGTGISRDQERFAVRELINNEVGPFLVGKDPIDTEKIWGDAPWELGMSYMSRGGVVSRAISAIDQALWDIKGQYVDLPIYRLLGGASPDSVRAYTTWGFNVYTKEELVESAVRAVRERGHNPLKYQAVAADRGRNVMVDAERLQAVREAVGDGVELIVDCNGKFDFSHARKFLRQIEPLNIACVDHTVYIRDIRMMRDLRACTSIPLAARASGENQWDNRDLIASGAVDIMHANVLDGGGYTECVKVAHMAEMYHLPLGTGGGWYLQNGHLIAGVRNGLWTEFHTLREPIYDAIYVDPPIARDGWLPLPDKPGMGLELNEVAVREYTEA
jgi:L-rhamnonate dehydratase